MWGGGANLDPELQPWLKLLDSCCNRAPLPSSGDGPCPAGGVLISRRGLSSHSSTVLPEVAIRVGGRVHVLRVRRRSC